MNKFQVVYFCRSYAHIKFYYHLLQKYKPEEIELYVCNRDIEKYFQCIGVVYKYFDYPFFDLSKKEPINSIFNVFVIIYKVLRLSRTIYDRTIILNGLSVDITFLYFVTRLSKKNKLIYYDECDTDSSILVKRLSLKQKLLILLSKFIFSLDVIIKYNNGESWVYVNKKFFKKNRIKIKREDISYVKIPQYSIDTKYEHVLLLGYSLENDEKLFGKKMFKKTLINILKKDKNLVIKFHPGGSSNYCREKKYIYRLLSEYKSIHSIVPLESLSSSIINVTSFGSTALPYLSDCGVKVICVGEFEILNDRTLGNAYFENLKDKSKAIYFPKSIDQYYNLIDNKIRKKACNISR